MSDNKRWFKVWNSLLTDPSFLITPLDNIGRWVLLGALISLHGNNGRLEIEEEAFKKVLRLEMITHDDNGMITFGVKNIVIWRDKNDNGKLIVIMKNWLKYQKDSTGYERLKRFRESHKDNGVRGDKIRLRKEKEYTSTLGKEKLFERFYKAYPKKRKRGDAEKAFIKINPDEEFLQKMIETIEKFKKSEDWIKDNGKYIPYPATWLHAKGWDDEISIPKEKLKWK